MAKQRKSESALEEKAGISQPSSTSSDSAKRIKAQRKQQPTVEELTDGILKGNASYLSRGITLIESKAVKHQEQARELINNCLPHANKSLRIGITGVPGVGKSTFIESFGNLLTEMGKKVAVLAVDPSSSLSKGSILGDKTRMETLVNNPHAYIRPSASGDSLGGVARKTREAIILCEAAGYNLIIIETVGVGQSETTVHGMTDFFLLLKLAGAGDELQGIKRGIMEMADAIVINKADGDNINAAKRAQTEFNRALHLYPEKENGWTPKTLTCSAKEQQGIQEIWDTINNYHNLTLENGYFQEKRHSQNKFWLIQTIENRLKEKFYANEDIKKALQEQIVLMESNKTTPFEAAEYLLTLS